MIAILLAAGYGTRLYPLTENTPKALLPVKGRPILSYLIEKLTSLPDAAGGSRPPQIVLVSNHRFAPAFEAWFSKTGQAIPWTVLDDGTTCDEDRLGSMGDLAFSIRKINPKEDLLVLGSDNLFPDRLDRFLSFAKMHSPAVTLGCYELPDRKEATRYGVLTADSDLRITGFSEKPANPTSSLISMAVYFFPFEALERVLEYVGSSAAADTLGSFIRWLLDRHPVVAHRFNGPWFDIGDIRSYTQAQETFIS